MAVLAAFATVFATVAIAPLSADAATATRTISGKVTLPAGTPAAAYDTVVVRFYSSTMDDVGGAGVSSNGTWSVGFLKPGKYIVQFDVAGLYDNGQGEYVESGLTPQYWNNAARATESTPVDITSASVSGINATLQKGSTVNLTVSDLPAGMSDYYRVIPFTADGEVFAGQVLDNGSTTFTGLPNDTIYFSMDYGNETSAFVQTLSADGQSHWTFDEPTTISVDATAEDVSEDSVIGGRATAYGFSKHRFEQGYAGAVTLHKKLDGVWVPIPVGAVRADEMAESLAFGRFVNNDAIDYGTYALDSGEYAVRFGDVDPGRPVGRQYQGNGPVTTTWQGGATSVEAAEPIVLPVAGEDGVSGVDGTIRPTSWTRPASGFVDVTPSSSRFSTEIAWMKSEGVSTGYGLSDGEAFYRPLAKVSREAMAAFLYRAAGSPEFTAPTTSPFVDVTPSNSPFYKEITWLASEGITSGWSTSGGQEFRPRLAITREAMAAFLYRAAGSPPLTADARSTFADVPPSNPFAGQIGWMAAEGISTGTKVGSKSYYKPRDPVLRDAMAAFLYRARD